MKKEQQRPRYTIQCRKCWRKWTSDEIRICQNCGNDTLFADDHKTAHSRFFINGVMQGAER